MIFLNLLRLLLTYSKGAEELSWLVKVITVSTLDMKWFLTIITMVIITAAFMFKLIIKDTLLDCGLVPVEEKEIIGFGDIEADCDPAPFGTFRSSFIATFQLIFMGAYEEEIFVKLYDKEGGGGIYYSVAWVWFIVFVLVIVVVSLNAMIALLGNSFQLIKDDETAQKRMDRLELIVEYHQLDHALDMLRSEEKRRERDQAVYQHLHDETQLIGFTSDVLLQRDAIDGFKDFNIKEEINEVKNMIASMKEEMDEVEEMVGEQGKAVERKELQKLVNVSTNKRLLKRGGTRRGSISRV